MADERGKLQSGVFISVEGAEGVGKSFFCQNLKRRLVELGRGVVLSREPGGTILADKIRNLFANPPEDIQAISELFLVSAARCQHVNILIRPHLNQGHWVITDRFFDSTYVYQGSIGGVSSAIIDQMTVLATGGLVPAITFLLDADTRVTSQRLQDRDDHGQDGAKRFDEASETIRALMRQAYLDLARRWPQRFYVLDASQSAEAVVDQAIQHLFDKGYQLHG